MSMTSRFACLVAPFALGAVGALAACGGSGGDGSGVAPPVDTTGTDGGTTHQDSGSIFGNPQSITSITVDPPTASLEVLNGAPAKQAFKATAHYSDKTTQPLGANVAWSVDDFQAGSIDPTGLFTASGTVGAVVNVTASYKGMKGTAQVTVKLHLQANPGNVNGAGQTALKGATTPDGSVVWAYPYNATVFPRGLAGPTLQWMNGGAADQYYVHVTSPTFELESFATAAPPSRFDFDPAAWQQFTDSTNGAASLTVARFDGTKATVVAKHAWTIAPASMRGTIYYWANNLGRVMRIKPGAAMPDDFANKAPLNDPNQFTQSSCLMTCHTVSADGSTIISGGGTFGGSYDLITGMPKKSLGGVWGAANQNDGSVIQWMDSALSPNGKYILVNSMGVALSRAASTPGPDNFYGLYDTASGALVPTGALDGVKAAMPAFSPDGSVVAYVDSGDPSAWPGWNNPNNGNLRAVSFDATKTPMATNARDLVQAGADPNQRIGWPSLTPDGKWVIYQRAVSADTRGGASDLFIASTTTANQEVRLAQLDGDSYPFAAGARDLSMNYEPTFAPVAAGGYFWVVLTSRRTYGNILTGDKTVVKQLWVAAIDLAPTAGKDPSHPPFRLPGQAIDSVNMRGFWALDPCKGDGQGCASGTECCGGYCDGSGDGGAPVCKSQQTTCSQNGDRCQASADCCNAPTGVTCINHVCSEPPPK